MVWIGVSRGAQVTGVAVCGLSLTWISTILRFYVRLGILKFVGREDWLTIAAMIIFTILCSLCLRDINFGLGAHMYNIPDPDLVTGFKIIFICELLYVVATAVVKLSIGAFFLRLSSKKYQVRTVYITLSFVLLFSTMYFFFLLFQCTPINHLWTRYEGGDGTCLKSPILANVTYAHAAMSAITDWTFGILPIFFVWNMQMNPRTKITVILILSLGFFASTATIVRIVYIKSLTETTDWSWEGINLVKWSIVEPAIAITAMNIATLRPMFKNFFFFTRKRFDSNIDDDEESAIRPSADSYTSRSVTTNGAKSGNTNRRAKRNTIQGTVSAKEYSVEFAEMLGLSRVGVTTEISAGGSKREKDHFRKRLNSAFRGEKGESQTELNLVKEGLGEGFNSLGRSGTKGGGAESFDWRAGITATTVITTSDNR